MEQPRWYKHLGNPPGQESGGGYARKWGLFRQRPKSCKFIPLLNTDKKGNTKFTREGIADTKSRTPPSSAHQIYGEVPAKIFNTLFGKIAGCKKQNNERFAKIWGELRGNRDMCMHHILEKCRNPNFLSFRSQAKELDSQYSVNVCTVIASGMDYIWRHGAADIQMTAPVGIKRKMDLWQKNSGYAKRHYVEARHLIGSLQGGVSENMENLPCQGSNMEKYGSE